MNNDELIALGNSLLDDPCKNVFPKNAEFSDARIDFDTECYIRSVSWKLNNAPNRPSKRSKTIKLKLTKEDLEDMGCKDLNFIKNKIKNHLTKQLNNFEPDHDTKYFSDPPVVEWSIPL